MADYTPLFQPGQAVTYSASVAVTGGQVVEVTGDRTVGPAAAGSKKVAGVAGFNAPVGERVTVFSAGVQRPVASGSIAAGDRVVAAANGKVAAGTTDTIGLALAKATNGETVQVRFDQA